MASNTMLSPHHIGLIMSEILFGTVNLHLQFARWEKSLSLSAPATAEPLLELVVSTNLGMLYLR